MMLDFLHLCAWAVLLFGAPPALYLGFLTLLSRRLPDGHGPDNHLRFAVVVPAHNEQAQIAETVASLLQVHYPKALFEVVVVADNCTDATADIAQRAGARVLVRNHATERGKGYALHHAFTLLLAEGAPKSIDAVVVVDADSIVSPNLLHAFAVRLAAGEIAVQADYGVRNPLASWRTRLMTVALTIFHRVRGIARERMGLSAGLRGNGMCFSRACLTRFPHEAHGLVEDVEYGITLGLGGARIAYADEARVLGEMVSNAQGSESQRARWESGRASLKREQLPKLLRGAWQRRSAMLLDLALDLAVPPLARVAVVVALACLLDGARLVLGGHMGLSSWVCAAALASLFGYVARGVQLSGLGFQAITALLWAPVYVVWKLVSKLRPKHKDSGWVRTAREGSVKPPDAPGAP